ncbi:MAG: hypothetical protein HY791_38355 [Deltaproteobacteria bacterium]|nr:hypothetical protein [Deltaproteobacteria bacterium]
MGRIVLIALAVVLGLGILQYTRSPQFQIKRVMSRAATAAENNQLPELLTEVSDAFRGFGGTKAGLEGLASKNMREGGWSSITIISSDIRMISDKEADATACVSFRPNAASDRKAGVGGVYELELSFRKGNDGVWRADQAQSQLIQEDPAIRNCR